MIAARNRRRTVWHRPGTFLVPGADPVTRVIAAATTAVRGAGCAAPVSPAGLPEGGRLPGML